MKEDILKNLREFLYNLVAIETPSGSESPGIKYLKEILEEMGLSNIVTQFVSEDSLNLIVNPVKSPDLVIMTHIDTIPPIASARIIDEYTIAGTGSVDAKGGIAALYYALMKNPEVPSNVSIVIVSNEENTGMGCVKYLEDYSPRRALVLEPTSLKLAFSSTGYLELKISLLGERRHPDLFVLVDDFEKREDPIRRMFNLLKDLSQELSSLGIRFSITYVSAGEKNETYATPERCDVIVNIPIPPSQTVAQILSRVASITAKYDAYYRVHDISNPYINKDEEFMKQLKEVYRKVFEREPEIFVFPSWTDATTTAERGIGSAIFGPGNPELAHTLMEKIDLREVIKAGEYLLMLLKSMNP
ncbi:MAG: M20/M25/M40 family metallo-hydrolase [Candidatus Njordarchaeales archaeon]